MKVAVHDAIMAPMKMHVFVYTRKKTPSSKRAGNVLVVRLCTAIRTRSLVPGEVVYQSDCGLQMSLLEMHHQDHPGRREGGGVQSQLQSVRPA